MAEDCLKCKEPLAQKGRSKYGRVCRPCVAEYLLSGDESKLQALLSENIEERFKGLRVIRDASCERCGESTNYTTDRPQGGVWCDDCGKFTCLACSKRVIVSFETTGGETIDQNADRFLCKNCRAARILGNWKVKYIVTKFDGTEELQETEP